MFRMLSTLLTLMMALGLLGGCATSGTSRPAKLPGTLEETGLVVLQVAPFHWRASEITIEGQGTDKLHNGFFTLELRPGQYKVSSVKAVAGYERGFNSFTTNYETLKLNRSFTIKAGKVTNLGMVYIHPGDKENQYYILNFKNDVALENYMRNFHPALARTIDFDSMIAAPGDYSNDRIGQIRRALLSAPSIGKGDSGLSPLRSVTEMRMGYQIGDLGILVAPALPGVAGARLIDTPVLGRLSLLDYAADRPYFLTGGGRLYRLRGSQFNEVKSLPSDYFANSGALFSDQGIALIDRHFNVLVSMDDGLSWKKWTQSSKTDDQFRKGGFTRSKYGLYAFAGQIAYPFGGDSVAVHIDPESGFISTLQLPDNLDHSVRGVFHTDAGIYIQEESGSPTKLYFRAHGTDKWIMNEVATYFGCKLNFPRDTGSIIHALCGVPSRPVKLTSLNHGKTWD